MSRTSPSQWKTTIWLPMRITVFFKFYYGEVRLAGSNSESLVLVTEMVTRANSSKVENTDKSYKLEA